MTRIKLDDTVRSVLLKMAEGNPGAITALTAIFKAEPTADPKSIWEGPGGILSLDAFGIYGPRIWMLFNDVCDRDPVAMLAVLRANQLGLLRVAALNHAIDNRGDGIDVVDLHRQVKERLGEFGELTPRRKAA